MEKTTRRVRQRKVLVDDILNEARRQLEVGGPAAVSLRGIARSVGVSAPSLYTYFGSLADVFTQLIVQSFDSLAAAVRVAVDAAGGQGTVDRLGAGPRAYRAWALANPQQFNLVFFDQVAGYEAPAGGPTVDAQVAVFRPIARVYAEARGIEVEALQSAGPELDGLLAWWSGFHGAVALEVNHHLAWVDAEAEFERRLADDIAILLGTSPGSR